jgi:hypothetical protein
MFVEWHATLPGPPLEDELSPNALDFGASVSVLTDAPAGITFRS